MKPKKPKSPKPRRIQRKEDARKTHKNETNAPKNRKATKRGAQTCAEKAGELGKDRGSATPVNAPDSPSAMLGLAPGCGITEEMTLLANRIAQGCMGPSMAGSITDTIHAARDLIMSADAWIQSPNQTDHRGPAVNPQNGQPTAEFDAWNLAAKRCRWGLVTLLQETLTALFEISRTASGPNASSCLEDLIARLVRTITPLNRLMRDERKRAIFLSIAQGRYDFPSLVTILPKQNTDAAKFILNELKLGEAIGPFKCDSRIPYTPFNNLAMRIVAWILRENHNPNSIYRKVVPVMKDFRIANISAWLKVIKFHLDYFQSPTKNTWGKYVDQYQLRMERTYDDEWDDDRWDHDGLDPGERFRRYLIGRCKLTDAPVDDLTEDPEFMQSLANDKQAKNSKTDFFHRVKGKVVEAVHSLIPD
jgi:hypothetical protein